MWQVREARRRRGRTTGNFLSAEWNMLGPSTRARSEHWPLRSTCGAQGVPVGQEKWRERKWTWKNTHFGWSVGLGLVGRGSRRRGGDPEEQGSNAIPWGAGGFPFAALLKFFRARAAFIFYFHLLPVIKITFSGAVECPVYCQWELIKSSSACTLPSPRCEGHPQTLQGWSSWHWGGSRDLNLEGPWPEAVKALTERLMQGSCWNVLSLQARSAGQLVPKRLSLVLSFMLSVQSQPTKWKPAICDWNASLDR